MAGPPAACTRPTEPLQTGADRRAEPALQSVDALHDIVLRGNDQLRRR